MIEIKAQTAHGSVWFTVRANGCAMSPQCPYHPDEAEKFRDGELTDAIKKARKQRGEGGEE
jgi:hypothetical protein